MENDPCLYTSIASGEYDFDSMASLPDIQLDPLITSDRLLRSFREIPRKLDNEEEREKFQNWVTTVLGLAKNMDNKQFIEQQ